MGYLIGDWPSYDPHNFSQLRSSDPAQPSLKILPLLSLVCFIFPFHITIRVLCSSFLNLFSQYISKKLTPATYHPTHSRTSPPPNQVISTEDKNILLRHFYQKAEEKLRPRRAASDNLMAEHASKQP